MTEQRFKQLLEGYLAGSLTSGQLKAFLKATKQKDPGNVLLHHLEGRIRQAPAAADDTRAAASLERFMARVQQGQAIVAQLPRSRRGPVTRRIGYAAAVLVMVGIAFFIITRDGRHDKVPPIPTALIAVAADHSAQLQLGDGSSVVLDSQAVESPVLLTHGITYRPDSALLVYKADQPKQGPGGAQTLSTGRGDQVSVVLPDGSRVWLNAKSALRYPATFQEKARVVELSGEAYFDVRPEPGKPFQVRTAKVMVTVLGTTFNLKAYAGEETITAGVYQGRVQVSDSARQTALSAGEQLVITSDGSWHAAGGAELAAAAGWKDKLFVFRRTPLPDIISELSRWYTVEFQIAPGLSRTFSGTIPRTATITTVLEVLKESGISFRKDGNKIVFFD